MTVISHYNCSKVKKWSRGSIHRTRVTKDVVMSLMLVHYNLFLRLLIKKAESEARNQRSKVIKSDHVKKVAKKILLKYRG